MLIFHVCNERLRNKIHQFALDSPLYFLPDLPTCLYLHFSGWRCPSPLLNVLKRIQEGNFLFLSFLPGLVPLKAPGHINLLSPINDDTGSIPRNPGVKYNTSRRWSLKSERKSTDWVPCSAVKKKTRGMCEEELKYSTEIGQRNVLNQVQGSTAGKITTAGS